MQSVNLSQNILDEGRTLKFTIEGDLDLITTPPIQERITQSVANTPSQVIVVDIRNVEFIDSAGLALLFNFHKSQNIDGKMLVIVRTKSQPARVLELGRFDTFIIIQVEE